MASYVNLFLGGDDKNENDKSNISIQFLYTCGYDLTNCVAADILLNLL